MGGFVPQSESTVVVTKGSATALSFNNRSGAGLYQPQTRARTSLQQNTTDGSWIETQPDGSQLLYGPPSATPGTFSNASWGYSQNLLGAGYQRPWMGTAVSTPNSSEASQPALLPLDRESSYGPPNKSSFSADGMITPMDQAMGAVSAIPWFTLPAGTPSGGAGNACASGACCCSCCDSYVAPSDFGPDTLCPPPEAVPGCCAPATSPSSYSCCSSPAPSSTYQMNLSSGNLLMTLAPASAGSSSPAVGLFYNSLAAAAGLSSAYGAGWTNLYQQRVDGASTAAWLKALVNPAGQRLDAELPRWQRQCHLDPGSPQPANHPDLCLGQAQADHRHRRAHHELHHRRQRQPDPLCSRRAARPRRWCMTPTTSWWPASIPPPAA